VGGATGPRLAAAGTPLECNPRLWVVEKGSHSNIKAGKTAIIKWRISPPYLSMGFSNASQDNY
jgi:hypothetical protein